MKKGLAIFLALLLLTAPLALAANVEAQIKSAVVATEIKANAMPLQGFLDLLQARTGVELAAVPEAAEVRVDMEVAAGTALSAVLAELERKYGLVGKVNPAKTALIVLQGAPRYDMMYAGKSAPAAANSAPMARGEAKLALPLPPSAYRPPQQWNTEEYRSQRDNEFQPVNSAPLSTFSIDVDTASYSNIRRYINTGNLPPADAVRTEELLNYFSYDYPQPADAHPIAVTTELHDAPWNPARKLLLLGIQGKSVRTEQLPPSNLVFLIDVSGSMAAPNKLPLLKTAFKLLAQQLRAEDKVAIVVYAGAAGVVLEPTPGSDKAKIIAKIDSLVAAGSTAGSEGLKLAYKTARENFNPAGNNRVILATDGDFNVGPSSEGELTRMIEEYRKDGVFLSILGFGMGNIKDNKMESMADHGNGNYAYIDNAQEAKKVLVSQLAGTLFTIAKDVKIQVEFNPAQVKAYRLLGYENRVLESKDFKDDKKDAGDMGAGHSVTALYELIPAASAEAVPGVDPLKYQQTQLVPSDEWLQVKVRYKQPRADSSTLLAVKVDGGNGAMAASENFRFAAAVAEYGMLLRNSEFKGQSSYEQALSLARGARGDDHEGYRAEFIRLLELSQLLAPAAK